MMALSLGLVAEMIDACELVYTMLYSVQLVDLAVGIEASLRILFIAMMLDRILQGVRAPVEGDPEAVERGTLQPEHEGKATPPPCPGRRAYG
jgi:ABC-type proline/glycine betaine transport system permease subunit